MAFREKLLFGLQRLQKYVSDLISAHNTNPNAHDTNINERINTHNTNIDSHPNGFRQWLKLTSNNNSDDPPSSSHKDMGDVSFISSNGSILANVGSDLLNDNGTIYRVVYLQALSNTSNQSSHTTISLKVTPDGTKKICHSDALFQTINTDQCTATSPTKNPHIANKQYVDNRVNSHTHPQLYTTSFFGQENDTNGYFCYWINQAFTTINGTASLYVAVLTYKNNTGSEKRNISLKTPDNFKPISVMSTAYSGTHAYNRKGRVDASITNNKVMVNVTEDDGVMGISANECVTVYVVGQYQ